MPYSDAHQKRNSTFFSLLLLLFFSFTVSSSHAVVTDTAVLTVNFPGLNNVHTDIRVSDNIAGSATGERIKRSNWKNDLTTVDVPQGQYDLIVRKGAGELIIDDVDCRSDSCTVDDIVATLEIDFPGLKSVHSSVHVPDNNSNQASGERIARKNWQNEQASILLLRQIVDVKIRKGAASIAVDNIDCRSGSCIVNDITATLTVSFPGMSGVHTSVRVPDNTADSASGEETTRLNWQTDQAIITVLRQAYDLKIRKNAETLFVDNIDCSSGSCQVDDLIATMTVDFTDLNGVHTSVRIPDNTTGQAKGQEVTKKNWQNDQAVITVFKSHYDLYLTHGAGSIAVDDIDCSSGQCLVDDLTTTLTVAFPGLSGVHTSVHNTDDISDSASGGQVAKKNWQAEQAVITLFPGTYDLNIRKGGDTIIIDDVDCNDSHCLIDGFTAEMTVNFPGLDAMHTSVHSPDDLAAEITGKKILSKNWKTDQAVLTVFKKQYDVSIRRNGGTQPIIRDNVDCQSGQCIIDNIVATMTVNFPGINSVHTSIRQPDEQNNLASGKEFRHKNWQTDQAVFTVLRQKYDASIKRKNSEPIIIDNVDCTSGNCTIDEITATLTVNFPEMTNVHTSVFTVDGNEGVVEGTKAFNLNWQNNQAVINVFKQHYDVSVKKGNSDPVIIDAIDCTSGSCTVDQITATMNVVFPQLSSVHTSVRVVDDNPGTAEGKEVSKKNWQKDKATLTVFRQQYDVRVKKGSITKVIDNVDCRSGNCDIDELTSLLTIEFPGLTGVHSSAHIPDAIDNTAAGEKAAKSNWKTHQTTISLLRETYDVKVDHHIDSIFDDVDCTGASCSVLITGNVQAILIDGDSNSPIADKTITAYEKSADGTLTRVMRGKTTTQGQINFTLNGINAGKVFVLKTYNPFGHNKPYFSSFINSEGEHKFIVTVDGENSLDLTPPEVSFSSPQDGGNVTNLGFTVTGLATDNRNIDRVELTVNDPVKGSHVIAASYNEATHLWTASVPETMVTLNNTITLTATAFDQAQSQDNATITVSVIEDNEGPEISIISHTENDEIPATGFLLSGTVTDLTEVASLKATLIDSSLGSTIDNQSIDFSINNGNWTMAVNNGLMSVGSSVNITLNATDVIGNASSKSIQLVVVAVDYTEAHMINRITFGATPTLVNDVNSMGALNYLEQQLDPASIDDSVLATMTAELPETKEQLQKWSLMHMAYSQRQLQEVMTWFWDNHFNTDINTTRNNAQNIELSNTVQYELAENQGFRANALGNFRDLLGISAKSPAMLIYLDSISNVAGDSNENYAREVKELFTMGVDGGYTAKDVENGAEIFTGWHVSNGDFFFDENLHTVGSYVMFEGTGEEVIIPEGGVTQGEMLLDVLATHPSTANFICKKMITLLVDDSSPSSLVTRCADEFLDSSAEANQIEQVLRVILQSAEFNDVAHYRSKIKTPVKFVLGAIRNLEASSDATDLIPAIRSMGIRLYENPVPTGWSEIGADWINSNLLIERLKWVNDFARNDSAANVTSSNPMQFYPSNGYETADGIVGFLLQMTVGDDFTELAHDNALSILGSGFDLSNPDSEINLRQLNGNVMSYPQYQFQ